MKINNFKIGTRLSLGFTLILLLMVLTVGISVNDLQKVESRLDDIVLDNNYKTRMVSDMSESVHIVSRVLRTIVLLDNSEAIAIERKKLDAARSKYDASLAALEKTSASEKGQAIRTKMKEIQVEARMHNDKVLDLALSQKDTEAVEFLLKVAGPATVKWQDALDENLALQEANTQDSYKAAQTAYETALIQLLALTSLAIAVGIAVAIFATRSITLPISKAVKVAQAVAAGNLTTNIEVHSSDETGQLLQALKDMNESLVKIVGEVRTGTDTIATASSQIAAGNMDLSSRTEEQASSLEETAASMEELTSTVKQNADNARQANQLAMSASDVAVRGGAVVSQVVDTMSAINDSAKKIADIIGVIDGIAFQTNILALNAAVEAARAGEQGRGFAVVATEVRSLAQRSAAAAKEIKTLIGDSVNKVDAGSKLVAEAGSTMNEVVNSVKRVTDMMGEITAASQEQSAGIEQVNQAVSQMDQVTQQNAALVEEAAAAAESLQEQSSRLAQSVSVFQLGGNHTTMKTAMRTASSHVNAKATTALTSSSTRSSVAPRMQAPIREKAVTTSAAEGWEEF